MAPRRTPGAGPDELDADLITEPIDGGPDAALGDETDASLELTGELDLHHFLPRECADVVTEYLRAAHDAGWTTVRIIHGKGTGTLRRIVHGALDRHPAVRAYHLATDRGGWGATVVELHAPIRVDGTVAD